MPQEIWIKLILSLVAVPIVLWGDRVRTAAGLTPRRASSLLVLLAVVAGANYYNFGAFHGGGAFVHRWEHFHYFLGSKYFPELGYDGLYAASLGAQRETHRLMNFQAWTRDLETNQVVSSFSVLADAAEVKERFTPERWEEFSRDNADFLDHMSWKYLLQVRKDHGYNPTPTWTFVARLATRWLPASPSNLTWLGVVDLVLLAVLFGFLMTTYGTRVGCLCLVVFGLGYPWRYDWIGGAFLRTDWLLAVAVAVCLVRRERYRWAGALLAYAGMVRIFPFAFLLGPAVLMLRAFLRREDKTWGWQLAQGFAVGLVVCFLAGGMAGRGFDAWAEFGRNLAKHEETWLTNNVGLKNTVLYDTATVQRERVDWRLPEPWLPWQRHMNEVEEERAVAYHALAGFFLLLVAAACWRAERDESLVLGIGAVFTAALLTCYYWAMLLLVPLRGDRLVAAVLLLLSAGLCVVHLLTPPSFEMIYGVMSWALAALLVAWVAPAAWKAVRPARSGPDRQS